MESDFRVYIALVNREDLLQRAVIHSGSVYEELTVIDNSAKGISFDPKCRVYRSPTPIQFAQSINFALLDAKKQGAQISMWLHCDAWTPNGDEYKRLIAEARRLTAEGRKWGALFTNYDALLAMNTAVIDDIGLWDCNMWYHCDQDWYRRLTLAGYEVIETGIHVEHDYSQTIKSDPAVNFMNSVLHPLHGQYYRIKWGGMPGEETYSTPFNRPDLLPGLKTI